MKHRSILLHNHPLQVPSWGKCLVIVQLIYLPINQLNLAMSNSVISNNRDQELFLAPLSSNQPPLYRTLLRFEETWSLSVRKCSQSTTYLHTTTGLMKNMAGDMFNPVERLGNAARGGSPSVVRDILEAGQAKVTTYAYHFTLPWY